MIKSAISPRPASWILERSIDGEHFLPWQYFGASDYDCQQRYNLPAHHGLQSIQSNSEVICSTKFSKPIPLENGEVRTIKLVFYLLYCNKTKQKIFLHLKIIFSAIPRRCYRRQYQTMMILHK